MLTRLYVDNFRCLNNFDLPLKELMLFLGSNGSGKSMILRVLTVLRRVIEGGSIKWLTTDTTTRWLKSTRQVFELSAQGPGGAFQYRLIIEHGAKPRARVAEERLLCDGQPLLSFEAGQVTMHDDANHPRPVFQLPQDQSALGTVVAGDADQRLSWFRRYITGMVLLRLEPARLSGRADAEAERLGSRGLNFASWYRHLLQAQPNELFDLRQRLRQVLPGFHSLTLSGGDQRTLRAGFSAEAGATYEFKFNELSDGQRALIVLYTLIHVLGQATVFIDEPQDYVALPELQPWLVELREAVQARGLQVLLISHHPELIDYLAPDAGVWLERSPNGPTRVLPEPVEDGSGLRLSERVARGWLR